MDLNLVFDNTQEVTRTVTMSEVKEFIRHLEAQGYVRETKTWNSFINETRSSGGIPLVLNNIREYKTIAIFLKK